MSRLSPDTAVRAALAEAQSLATVLEQVSLQLASSAGQAMARDLRTLIASDIGGQVRVDVARPDVLTEEQGAALATVLGTGPADGSLELPDRWTRLEGERALRVFTFDQPPLTPGGQMTPPYLVIALANGWRETALVEELEELASQRSRVLLVALDDIPGAELRELARRLQRHAWQVDVRQVHGAPALPDGTAVRPWLDELAAPEWEAAHMIAQAHALVRACQQVTAAFELLLRRETEALRVRKALVGQRVQQTRAESAPLRPQEIAREAEAMVKQEFAELGRGVSDQLAEWMAPQTGELSRELHAELGRLTTLHEQRQSSQVVLAVPPEFEKGLLDLLHTRLLERARRDMVSLAEVQQLLKERIAAGLRETGALEVPISFGVPQLERFERFLNNRLHIESPYRSESRVQGPMEYLMAARRYAMVIPMAGMLVMPFASEATSKSMKQLLGMAMAVMMVVGGFLVYRRVPVERAEQLERELEKAREMLRRELRRMVQDAEREWMQVFGEHLRDQPSALRAELESTLDALSRRQAATNEQEHVRVERQMHGLQNTERQIADAEKQRNNTLRTLDQLRDRLQQLFGDMQQGARRSAAAPMRT